MELVKGAMLGQNIIGEVTESIHKFLIDQYSLTEQVPRFEEDLSFFALSSNFLSDSNNAQSGRLEKLLSKYSRASNPTEPTPMINFIDRLCTINFCMKRP